MTDYLEIDKEVDKHSDAIWDLASHVWAFAEVGLEEQKSSAYASALLEKNGLKISQGSCAAGRAWHGQP